MKITEALVAEHTIFLNVFDQIERALPALTTLVEVRTLGTMVEGLLASHGETEQDLAYLALDHVLAERGELERLHQEHQEIDGHLKQVRAATELVKARELLQNGLALTRRHFKYEERHIFPLLERSLREETLRELGSAWRQRWGALQPA